MKTFREKVQSLSDQDLALLVLVTAEVINEEYWRASIARQVEMRPEELEDWLGRVIWTDDPSTSLYEDAVDSLGFADPTSSKDDPENYRPGEVKAVPDLSPKNMDVLDNGMRVKIGSWNKIPQSLYEQLWLPQGIKDHLTGLFPGGSVEVRPDAEGGFELEYMLQKQSGFASMEEAKVAAPEFVRAVLGRMRNNIQLQHPWYGEDPERIQFNTHYSQGVTAEKNSEGTFRLVYLNYVTEGYSSMEEAKAAAPDFVRAVLDRLRNSIKDYTEDNPHGW